MAERPESDAEARPAEYEPPIAEELSEDLTVGTTGIAANTPA